MQSDEERVTDVLNQDVPLGHDVLYLVLLQYLTLVNHLDGVKTVFGPVSSHLVGDNAPSVR